MQSEMCSCIVSCIEILNVEEQHLLESFICLLVYCSIVEFRS